MYYVFDAYGTLLDVNAAARKASLEDNNSAFQDNWAALSEIWRRKQLEYTWLRAITNAHADFWQVTQDGLDYALEALKLDDPVLRERLLGLYRTLEPYPEVEGVLKAVKAKGAKTAILSNGTPDMLEDAARSANIINLLDDIFSIESVGVYKPAPQVYQMVCDAYQCAPKDVAFFSSNGWDAAGAAGFGFNVTWVNRASLPIDRMPWTPNRILSDLTSVPELF